MIKRYQLLLAIALLIVLTGFTSPAMAFKPYRGKVIDADTKEPIEGAVVAGIWTRNVKYFPSGSRGVFKKARETVTDKNGEFSIKPYHHYSLRPFSELWLYWVIYKPGYASFDPGHHHWHPGVKPKGISPNGLTSKIFRPYTVVELPKLKTRKERREYLWSVPPSGVIPAKKVPLLLHAYNNERVELGMRPVHTKEVPYK